MAIHLSLRVAPLDLQQGGNSRIPYVHVHAARMSILVYIATAINTFLFLLTKHPLFLRSFGTGIEMGAFSTTDEGFLEKLRIMVYILFTADHEDAAYPHPYLNHMRKFVPPSRTMWKRTHKDQTGA
ncbi:cytochrome c assembly protein, Cytochrome c-type biogenesis protein CcmC [Artemisia annua]|uniref:Cytochrome c assembly protein, Cytochrome c-type biogenesis protein CcmC n=1 Tax=Artemisia annua TaxID=35608 RepID=A0A2U1PB95_ARTAN|nr:cytochrome c assembly protein, Cytochrome c-type biogenesis protein CcmC [Artemisia annua]